MNELEIALKAHDWSLDRQVDERKYRTIKIVMGTILSVVCY